MSRVTVLTSSPARLLASALFLTCLACLEPAQARAAECSAAGFKVGQSIPTGDPSFHAITADFNNDGRADLAATRTNSAQVQVVLGQGADGFGPPKRFATNENPFGLAAGDFNGDGKLDLFTTRSNTGSISVLFGDGAGNFAAPVISQSPWFGAGAGQPAAGDFNGDGRDDVAVGVGINLHILISNGAGGFTPTASSPLTVGDSGAHNGRVDFIRIVDLNGDGKRDVIAQGKGLNILLGDGAGGFAAPVKLLPDTAPFAFAVDDFNGDGRADLAASEAAFGAFAVAVLLGNGDGTFAAPLRRALTKEPSHLASADFNGDGKRDLAVAVRGPAVNFLATGASLLVLSGDGAGNFAATSPLYALPTEAPELLPADFNADGRPDLAAAGNNFIFVYHTAPDGRPAAPINVDAGPNPGGTVTADFNNDGKADLAVTNNWFQTNTFSGGQFSVHLGDGAGNFTRSANISTGQATLLQGMTAADFNGDGKKDLAVASRGSGTTSVYLGNGDGTFTARPALFAFGSGGANFVEAGDFNNDSKIDLLVSYGGFSTNAAIFRGDGAGNFSNPTGILFDSNGTFSRFTVGDLNADGHLDAAFATFHGQRVVVTFNDGFGNLSAIGPNTLTLPLAGRGPLDVAAHDFNGDGKLDLAVSSDGVSNSFPAGVVSVALNNGAGGFGAFADYTAPDNPDSLVVGEFNGDGFADIATSAGTDAVSVLTGDGAGGFGPGVTFQIGDFSATNSVVTADFTGDGKNDIAVARPFAASVAILVNNFAGDVPCVSVSGPTVTEGDAGETDAVFTVTLSEASAQTVRVNYFFTDGVGVDFSGGGFFVFSARNGIDYRGEAGTVVFAPGTTTQTITAKIIGDTIDEFDEPFDLNLSTATNASLTVSRIVTKITDDDAPPAISISDAAANEGSSGVPAVTAAFAVTLSAPSAKSISVQFATAPGTAATNDYSTFINSLNFAPGETSKTINVPHTPDGTHEPDETYFVNLSAPTNATLADAQGQGTITNDDPLPTVRVDNNSTTEGTGGTHTANIGVRLSNPSSQTITVNYATVDDTATAGSDYTAASGTLTFNPGELLKTVAVTIIGDDVDETGEQFILRLSNPSNATLGAESSFRIFDDDGPTISINDVTVSEGNSGVRSATFTISLSAASLETVSVRLSTANGTATAFFDYLPFSTRFVFIPAGQTSATTNVSIIGDFTNEPDETFTVNLTESANGTLGDASGVGTITNDDAPGGFEFSAEGVAVGEGEPRVQLTVTRAGDTSSAASVDYATADSDTFTVGCADATGAQGNAFARCDFATAVGTLRFAAGETSKTISVPIIDDGHDEGSETFHVVLGNPSGASLGTLNFATVTITDNDAAGAANPVLGPPHQFFVRQQYLDFLSREPDDAGFNAWLNVLNTCPDANTGPQIPSGCDRIFVSGEGFFRSVEFQLKGAYAFRFYKVAFNRLPEYREIIADMSFVAGATAEEVFARRAELAVRFTQRPDFQTAYGARTNEQYVAALLGRYNLQQVTTPDPQQPDTGGKVTLTSAELTARLNTGTLSRAQVLRAVVDSDEVGAAEFNNAFVAIQYYGYLRRKPEPAGYEAWLQVLQAGDTRTMVNGFLNSTEYKLRFGQP